MDSAKKSMLCDKRFNKIINILNEGNLSKAHALVDELSTSYADTSEMKEALKPYLYESICKKFLMYQVVDVSTNKNVDIILP